MTNLQSNRTSQGPKVTSSQQSSLERKSNRSIKLDRPKSSPLSSQSSEPQFSGQSALEDKPSHRLNNMLDVPSKNAHEVKGLEAKGSDTQGLKDQGLGNHELEAPTVNGHSRDETNSSTIELPTQQRPKSKEGTLKTPPEAVGDETKTKKSIETEQPVKIDILGMDFDNFSMQELLDKLKKGIIFTPNVDHLMKLRNDPEFAQVYQKADFKICDSQIVMYASKFLGRALKEKLSGSDLFPSFCEHHKHNDNIKIFLLGGEAGVAKQAKGRINQRIGREIVVGEYSPPFGFEHSPEECDRIVEQIQASEATVIAVCLGAPKQEKWIATYSDRLPTIDIFMAVGAVVDFEAGTKPRAPKYVSELGLEWLYRLVCEPRRLWKRYLLEDMPFVGLVLAEKFKQMTTAGR